MATTPPFTNPAGATDNGKAWVYDHNAGTAPMLAVQRETGVDARKYGLSTSNSQAANAAALQAAVDAMSAGQVLILPNGTYAYNSTISVPTAISIVGESAYRTVLTSVGCNGFSFAAGLSNVALRNFELASSVRYTTTPNAYVGFTILGSTGSRPQKWVIEDVFVDGFYKAIESNWLWSSSFRNFRCGSCHIGVHAIDLSVNNFFTHGSLGGSAASGSRGIWLDGSSNATEGWVITDSLIDSFEIAVLGHASTHNHVANCILDHCTGFGVYILHAGANFGGNWKVTNNYIAMSGSAGTAAMANGNTVSNSQNRGSLFAGNECLVYSGSACVYGHRTGPSANSGSDRIVDNVFKGFTTADIRADASDASILVRGNVCLTTSPGTSHIYGGKYVTDNVGTALHITGELKQTKVAEKLFAVADAAPASGTWALGDVVWNRLPTSGGTIGWVCTTAGTPGTWKTWGVIS